MGDDTKLMEKDLESLGEVLDESEVEYFLEFGTLLGAYRDGEFLPGDKDIDIGVYGGGICKVRELVRKAGFQVKPPTQYLSLRRNGVTAVDIHFYREQHDCYQTYVKEGKPYFFFPKRFRELKKFKFKGRTWNIPKDTEGYLTWWYGDWKDKTLRNHSSAGWTQKSLN